MRNELPLYFCRILVFISVSQRFTLNKRIVITGPESTGKSAITTYLARRLDVPFADEYARIFLQKNGPEYDYDLLLEMSRQHRKYQNRHVPPNAALGLLDTDLTNYEIWCREVFGKCHDEILSGVKDEKGHVYLLCSPDLPWEADPLREHPEDRERLFDQHKTLLEKLNRPYLIIQGNGRERFEAAEQAALRLIA